MEEYINEQTIVKDNIYDMFSDSIQCQICKVIMISPLICLKCQNRFCKKCMEQLKESEYKCPGKCEDPNITEVTEKNNYIKKFKFKCIKGCGKILKYEEIEFHYIEDCSLKRKKTKVMTPNETAEYKKKTGKDVPHLTSK